MRPKASELLTENYRALAVYYAIHVEVSRCSRGRERVVLRVAGISRAGREQKKHEPFSSRKLSIDARPTVRASSAMSVITGR